MRSQAAIACFFALCMLGGGPARASDPAAGAVTKLFIEACIPNMGSTDGVRAWARTQHLSAISNPAALELFVGPGGGGAAWAVPTPVGNFALSVRARTHGRVAWAQRADPVEVEQNFRSLMGRIKRPGLVQTVTEDNTTTTPFGNARTLAYTLQSEGRTGSFVFLMLTAEHAGGAFQAQLEVARATAP